MMWNHGAYGMGWMMWVMMIGGLVLLVVLVAAIVWAGVAFSRRDTAPPGEQSNARRILDERFARGEIDEDEYGRRSRALSGHGSAGP